MSPQFVREKKKRQKLYRNIDILREKNKNAILAGSGHSRSYGFSLCFIKKLSCFFDRWNNYENPTKAYEESLNDDSCEDVEVPMCATLGYNHTNVKLSPLKE